MAMLTYSTCLSNVIIRSCRTTEQILAINLAAAREEVDKRKIEYISWGRTADNTTDSFTEAWHNSTLQNVMKTENVYQRVSRRVIREDVSEE